MSFRSDAVLAWRVSEQGQLNISTRRDSRSFGGWTHYWPDKSLILDVYSIVEWTISNFWCGVPDCLLNRNVIRRRDRKTRNCMMENKKYFHLRHSYGRLLRPDSRTYWNSMKSHLTFLCTQYNQLRNSNSPTTRWTRLPLGVTWCIVAQRYIRRK